MVSRDGWTNEPPGPDRAATRIEVLGPCRLITDDPVPLPQGRQGLLLQMLLLHPNTVIDAARLVGTLWPGADRTVAARRLRVTATRLRRALSGDLRIEAVDGGYRLAATASSLDRLAFEHHARRAQDGNPDAARQALALWRGEPYLGFAATPDLRRQRTRLRALRTQLDTILDGSVDRAAPPASSRHVVCRLRLLAPFPRIGAVGVRPGALRVIAVTAPAGYGKSVLLAQWAARERPHVAWLRLAAAHNDATLFTAALRTAFETASGGTLPRRPLVGDAPASGITQLINDLLELGRPLGIVLDDQQRVTNPDVHAALEQFVHHCPTHVTVAIGSRQALPFPVARLEASGRMRTLMSADLAFTRDETDGVVRAGGNALEAPQLDRLQRRTGGWPQPVAGMASADRKLDDLTGRPERHLPDGLLADLPSDLARLLMDIAHLDDPHPQVCAAVANRPDAFADLDILAARHGLLRRDGEGYRHHTLLASALRARTARKDAARAARIHRRAARWYLERGQQDAALDHAVTGEHTDLIAAALGPAVSTAMKRADAAALRRWAATVTPPDGSTDALAVVVLATAFLAPEDRKLWRDVDRGGGHDGLVAAVEALDCLRAGRCDTARTAVEVARRRLGPETGPRIAALARTLLTLTETDCRILRDGAIDDEHDTRLLGLVDAADWPWLTLWAVGQRALDAYVSGDACAAAALLTHIEPGCELHPSWRELADGSACVTRALIDSDHARSADEHRRAADAVEAVVVRSDAQGRAPMQIIARYASYLVHCRAGDERTAQARRAEADAAIARHPDLAFLRQVRGHLDGMARRWRQVAALDDLTPTERVVLEHLDSDLTLSEIVDELHVSIHTLRTHIRSIYRKLGVSTRIDAMWVHRQR